jgi:hypothetical protein
LRVYATQEMQNHIIHTLRMEIGSK